MFALEHHLPDLTSVLTPRIKGFALLRSCMEGGHAVVYDVTIAYTRKGQRDRPSAPSLADIVTRRYGDVHVYVQRFPLESLPQDSSRLAHWLIGRYKEKDRLLQNFYNGYGFPGTCWHQSMSTTAVCVRAICWAGLLLPCLTTKLGRSFYLRLWVMAGLGGMFTNYMLRNYHY